MTGIAGWLLLSPYVNRNVNAQDSTKQAAEQQSVAASLEGAFMHISDTVGPATVSVMATSEEALLRSAMSGKDEEDEDELFRPRRTSLARGSGVIVRADGYILTNDHIVEEATSGRVKVTLYDGTTYLGTCFRDSGTDLAVVKITPEKPLPFVRLADSRNVRVGQWAIAIGSPFGQQNTMTTGIVSALHRSKDIVDGGQTRHYTGLIQTDASINPGNSGGPLLNRDGELIGINVAIFSPTGTSLGIGYAIPSNTARRVMEALVTKGKVTGAGLGVVPEDVPAGLRRRLGTVRGAYINEVRAGTPAQEAGIDADDVITRFGNYDIEDEDSLREAIAATAPKTMVPITLLRGGKSRTVSVTLVEGRLATEENRPTPSSSVAAPPRSPESLGIRTGIVTSKMLEWLKRSPPVKGVAVARVRAGSPAQQAGLRMNNLIYAVNGELVSTNDGLRQALAASKSGETVTLSVCRFDPTNPVGKANRAAVNVTVP